MITVPIVNQFDHTRKIGSVTIDETHVQSVDAILSLGYRLTEKDGFQIMCFGLIEAQNHPAALRLRDGIDG